MLKLLQATPMNLVDVFGDDVRDVLAIDVAHGDEVVAAGALRTEVDVTRHPIDGRTCTTAKAINSIRMRTLNQFNQISFRINHSNS